jgi:6-phosphogluconolactonase
VTRPTTVPDPEAAAIRAADVLARLMAEAQAQRGVAHVALAGGTTPRRAYELLAERVADWSAVALWFGDERCVPADDPESNYRMVTESLLSRVELDPARVHRIAGELGPDPAAEAYARELRATIPATEEGIPSLDVALLGLGEDGHTASLFPGSPALDAEDLCAGVHDAPKPPPERVTLTLRTLGGARRCLLLATGASKAHAVAATLAGPDRRVPASLLPSSRLEMIVDDAAAPGHG